MSNFGKTILKSGGWLIVLSGWLLLGSVLVSDDILIAVIGG